MLADRALASETDVEESKPGVAEIKVDETTKLVGLLEDLSKRLKKLETVTAAEKKRNSGCGRANNNYAPRPPFIPNAQATEFVPTKQSSFNNAKQNIRPYVYRRRTHSKIMLRTESILLMHLFATFTKLSVTRHARAETLAHFL